MITLRDGPAAGTYPVRRAPLYLRAVVSKNTKVRDVLDAPDDVPTAGESLSVYRRVGEATTVHLNMRGKGSGFYAMAEYEWLPDVDGEQFRDALAWRTWAGSNP